MAQQTNLQVPVCKLIGCQQYTGSEAFKVPKEILINEDVKTFWYKYLTLTTSGEKILKDLEKRGVDEKILNKFEIGLTLEEKALKKFLKEMSEKIDDLQQRARWGGGWL